MSTPLVIARIEFYSSRTLLLSQRYRWRCLANNGEVIAQSSEGYRHRDDCEHGARLTWAALVDQFGAP